MDVKDRIERIRALPAELRAAVAGMTDAQLDTPYRDGGWTVRQLVHHVADSHMHAFLRMKFALTEDAPQIKPYNQDVWATTPDVSAQPLESSLAILEGLHRRWVALLEAMPAGAISRKAYHPERGNITIDDMLTTYANHGVKHVGHITGLRTARGW